MNNQNTNQIDSLMLMLGHKEIDLAYFEDAAAQTDTTMFSIFDTEPDFVNEQGTQWWRDQSTTEYAQREDYHGTALPDATCWFVKNVEGGRERILVMDNEVIANCATLEGMAVKIDMIKLHKRMGKEVKDGIELSTRC